MKSSPMKTSKRMKKLQDSSAAGRKGVARAKPLVKPSYIVSHVDGGFVDDPSAFAMSGHESAAVYELRGKGSVGIFSPAAFKSAEAGDMVHVKLKLGGDQHEGRIFFLNKRRDQMAIVTDSPGRQAIVCRSNEIAVAAVLVEVRTPIRWGVKGLAKYGSEFNNRDKIQWGEDQNHIERERRITCRRFVDEMRRFQHIGRNTPMMWRPTDDQIALLRAERDGTPPQIIAAIKARIEAEQHTPKKQSKAAE